ncbi:diaminopimelate epimerase [Robiginitalea sp. IMCC43444]|uniref:diaminopimelate epimerase n=1 Tax=Robiginitalea sp. IMCC43444 TaxID=3459121 RepID=UPI0040424764
MSISFSKYQATGNDFILIDNRLQTFPKNDTKAIAKMCHRRFGVGADGLILLETDNSADFRMVYFNSDGKPGSMCGNGGRCITAFARQLGILENTGEFVASDGPHQVRIQEQIVSIQMQEVTEIREKEAYSFLDTGSPHHVQIVLDLDELDVKKEGARLRYGLYGKKGSNINFVLPLQDNRFKVRTYERGVEDETYSCGTGVTAVALAMHHKGAFALEEAQIETLGGQLSVQFAKTKKGVYRNIWLTGPAVEVFKGVWP